MIIHSVSIHATSDLNPDIPPFVWRRGDAVEDLKSQLEWLLSKLSEPTAIAIDNKPELPKL